MEIRNILGVAGNLIKAIDENKRSGQLPENNFCEVVPIELIRENLEELREWVKNGTLEIRETD